MYAFYRMKSQYVAKLLRHPVYILVSLLTILIYYTDFHYSFIMHLEGSLCNKYNKYLRMYCFSVI